MSHSRGYITLKLFRANLTCLYGVSMVSHSVEITD